MTTFLAISTVLFGLQGVRGVETKIALLVRGGYETDLRDHGRPVSLVAGALGITPETFRRAFSRVNPSASGEPPEEWRVLENKRVLLESLRRYGITNEGLDRVSDYYRYRPEIGERWPTREAKVVAVLRGGVVKRIEIVDGGAGYTSLPRLSFPNGKVVTANVALAPSRDVAQNGRLVLSK